MCKLRCEQQEQIHSAELVAAIRDPLVICTYVRRVETKQTGLGECDPPLDRLNLINGCRIARSCLEYISSVERSMDTLRYCQRTASPWLPESELHFYPCFQGFKGLTQKLYFLPLRQWDRTLQSGQSAIRELLGDGRYVGSEGADDETDIGPPFERLLPW